MNKDLSGKFLMSQSRDMGMYELQFWCLLPKGLYTMLVNSKMHYIEGEAPENILSLGVRYSSKTKNITVKSGLLVQKESFNYLIRTLRKKHLHNFPNTLYPHICWGKSCK